MSASFQEFDRPGGATIGTMAAGPIEDTTETARRAVHRLHQAAEIRVAAEQHRVIDSRASSSMSTHFDIHVAP